MSAIQRSATWPELFEHASRALTFDRRAWGDDEALCVKAAEMWTRARFVMSADRSARFRGPQGTRWVVGAALQEASFEAGKFIAAQLMSPLPSQGWRGFLGRAAERMVVEGVPWRRGKGPWLGEGALKSAYWRVEDKCAELAADLMQSGAPGGEPDELGGLVAKLDEDIPCGLVHESEGERDWGWPWEGALDDDPLPEGGAFAQEHAEGMEAFAALREEGGFAWVGTGPRGGWGQGVECAREGAANCRSLARAVGMGAGCAGLGFLCFAVNAYKAGSMGSYSHGLICLGKRAGASSLTHEWIHALEDARGGGPERWPHLEAALESFGGSGMNEAHSSRWATVCKELMAGGENAPAPGEVDALAKSAGSAFLFGAMALDARGGAGVYWAHPCEMLERMGEARLAWRMEGQAAFLAELGRGWGLLKYPQGGEAEATGAAIDAWIRSCLPWIESQGRARRERREPAGLAQASACPVIRTEGQPV